jgi:hypothetical protein
MTGAASGHLEHADTDDTAGPEGEAR